MDTSLYLLTLVTALGCGLNAGALFTFSSFVLKALGSLPPAQGTAATAANHVRVVAGLAAAAALTIAIHVGSPT